MTATTQISGQQAYDALARVVERHGADTLYGDRDSQYSITQSCRNVDVATGKGMCIVGCVLVEEFGISPERFAEKNCVGSGINGVMYYLPEVNALLGNGDTLAYKLLEQAQYTQDQNKSWGEALAAAKHVLDKGTGAA